MSCQWMPEDASGIFFQMKGQGQRTDQASGGGLSQGHLSSAYDASLAPVAGGRQLCLQTAEPSSGAGWNSWPGTTETGSPGSEPLPEQC